jgi:hypothetical protein
MNISQVTFRMLSAVAALAALVTLPRVATAVNLAVQPSTIEQYGVGSAFYLGHTVLASTNYSNLVAGGGYSAQCAHPSTLPVTGERTLASTTFGVGINSLVVTIPANQPALANLTGWYNVAAGTTLSCNYRWTAFATESGMTIGAGGISYTIGGGTQRDGGTVDFTMTRGVPAPGGAACTP